ncbi:MAG: ABC transporter ATP-binding protein [Paludibacteraceae bacterium]|nr:ABC transporter ATP-binding protein [Paludibacteraceae bacterium]
MIKASNINKSFGRLQVLKNVDLTVSKGEFVTIMGASGAGKTTLLQILGTLDKPDSGNVLINNTPVFDLNGNALAAFRNNHIGFVFQFHQLLPEFTAIENIMIPAMIGNRPQEETRKRAEELLEYLNIKDRADHKPNELSGGEKQRIAVARALINKPDVIFADEPSGSLDSKNKEELHNLFLDLKKSLGQTLVIVTHDPELSKISDRVVQMRDGFIAE